jgi:penicillin amidase
MAAITPGGYAVIGDLAVPRPHRPKKGRRSTAPFLTCLVAAWLVVIALVSPLVRDGAPVARAATASSRVVTLTLAGVPTASPIAVTYDSLGTPHVVAPTEAAGSGGLCWAMAHDRLFQLDLLRRSAQGRLAEILGAGPSDAVLQQDEFMRTEGLTALADAHWLAASPRVQVDLAACAAGINAVILADEANHGLPLEFADLNYRPDLWQPRDSMLIALLMTSSLDAGVWEEKIARAAVLATAGSQVAKALIPTTPATPSMFDRSGQLNPLTKFTAMPIAPASATSKDEDQQSADTLQAAAQLWVPHSGRARGDASGVSGALAPMTTTAELAASSPGSWFGLALGTGRASNNVAVGGELTASGMPLLANDPHLALTTPSLLYLAQVSVPGRMDIEGLTVPGFPAFISGQNDHIAFGITYAMIDDVDVYAETLRQVGNGQQVFYDGRWVPVQARTETIAVAGGAAVQLTVRTTPHGPILNDALPNLDAFGPLALKSTAAQPAWTVDGFFDLVSADDWTSFRQTVARESIGLNFVYADRAGPHGHIGYQMAGLAPQHQSPLNGLVPVPGGDGAHEWVGYAIPRQLPGVFDPPSHLLVTANNRIVPDDYAPGGTPIYISGQWDEPWRVQRAVMLLTGLVEDGHAITEADLERVQLDVAPAVGRPIAADLLAALGRAGYPADDPDGPTSMAALQTWDGDTSPSSAGGLLYEVMLALLTLDAAEPVLGSAYSTYAAGVFITSQEQACWQLLVAPQAPFIGATGPAGVAAARDAAVSAALGETDALLRQTLGPDPTAWSWGNLHRLTYNHPLAAVDARFAVGTFPTGGDPATLDTGGWDTAIGLLALPPDQLAAAGGARAAFAQDALASARVIWDLADPGDSLGVLSTGASGDPTSPHYADQAAQWRAGQYNYLA